MLRWCCHAPLWVDAEFTQSDVTTGVLLVNTTEGTQEATYCRPHPLGCVDVHFADAVAVIIPCPFPLTMTDCRVEAGDVMVAQLQ